MRERYIYGKNKYCIIKNNKNQKLQRRGEGANVITFSLYSLTTTTYWERGGDLTTY